ncbi:hypothetical protein WISP_126705 [Willisornis vidua]|uniref:Uncharacterized protein n=1 Tax=Willisornis vidua TaxID=1566151 RepID=A0ABQ9CWX1_9PASS|nr:hypothetical protein WISP_126705 [Willisornis vidua]
MDGLLLLFLSTLQYLISMREKLIHELEEERHLRLESEKRLREVTLESERSRAQMRGLQEQFSSRAFSDLSRRRTMQVLRIKVICLFICVPLIEIKSSNVMPETKDPGLDSDELHKEHNNIDFFMLA